MQNDHYEMNRQILTLQELSGQSQRRLQELRGALEERTQAAPAPSPAGPRHPPTARAPARAPGPGQLFQSSLDQLRRGSVGVARSGFEELLRTYPTYEDAPEAMVYIAETYAAERNQAAADSVYGLVVQRYPAVAEGGDGALQARAGAQVGRPERRGARLARADRTGISTLGRSGARARAAADTRQVAGEELTMGSTAEMPFLDHLEELRWRIIWSLAAHRRGRRRRLRHRASSSICSSGCRGRCCRICTDAGS